MGRSGAQWLMPVLAAVGVVVIAAGVGGTAVRPGEDRGKNEVAVGALMAVNEEVASIVVNEEIAKPPFGSEPQGRRQAAEVGKEEVILETEPVLVFDGRPLRKVKTLRMRVTAYTPGPESCGTSADGITASGKSVWINGMRLVAADTKLLPFGTILTIPGYNDGQPVQVWDRGGAIKGHRLDVLFATVLTAKQWGVQMLDVDVWEFAE